MSDYADSWREYRKRRNLVLFRFLGYLPVGGVIAFTVRAFGSEIPGMVTAFSWMVFGAVAGIRFQFFSCPRCGKPFVVKWWYSNIFARPCVHCGLPKFASG